jgi:hypothetical protein
MKSWHWIAGGAAVGDLANVAVCSVVTNTGATVSIQPAYCSEIVPWILPVGILVGALAGWYWSKKR